MYTKNLTVKLKNSEILSSYERVDKETGEVTSVIVESPSSIPPDKSRLDYEEFSMINSKMLRVLKEELTHIEMGITMIMIERTEFGTNSLRPLCNDTSIRNLAEIFKISINTVPKVFDSLLKKGVFGSFKVREEEMKEYWILNPYISWKGRLKDDSIFKLFSRTRIVKLL